MQRAGHLLRCHPVPLDVPVTVEPVEVPLRSRLVRVIEVELVVEIDMARKSRREGLVVRPVVMIEHNEFGA